MKLSNQEIYDLIDIIDNIVEVDDLISEKKDCKKTIQELINEIAVAKEEGCRKEIYALSRKEIDDLIDDIDDIE